MRFQCLCALAAAALFIVMIGSASAQTSRNPNNDENKITISFIEDHTIFAPGQSWPIEILPQLTDRANRVRVMMRVLNATTAQPISRFEFSQNADESKTHTIEVPKVEGVYELEVRLVTARNNLNRLLPARQLARQRIEFVVLAGNAKAITQPVPWQQAISFDPSQPRWWERLGRIPRLEPLSINPNRLRGTGTAQSERWNDANFSRLEVDGWQSYPLPVSNPGLPHWVEVEYPANTTQTLGVSVVEPGGGGFLSQDVVVSSTASDDAAPINVCRLVFWPNTRLPSVLLSNLDADHTARFAKIRLLEGPRQLEPMDSHADQEGFRRSFARIKGSEFVSFFGAGQSRNQSALDEPFPWQATYTGTRRMVEYLHHCGLSGARITCFSRDESLSPLLQESAGPASHHDDLELILRMFDRSDLRMIVGVRFDFPIPELESALDDSIANSEGIRLVGPTSQNDVPRYNVLDARVQAAMARILRRIAGRYGHHRSFAGLSIELSPNTTGHVVNDLWARDAPTISSFTQYWQQQPKPPTPSPTPSPSAPLDTINVPNLSITEQLNGGDLNVPWTKWRAARIANFYSQVAAELRRNRPDAQFLLDPSDLVDSRQLETVCQPTFSSHPPIASTLESMGLDFANMVTRGVTVAQPLRDTALLPVVSGCKYDTYSSDDLWANLASTAPNTSATISRSTRRQSVTTTEFGELTGRFQSTSEPRATLRAMAQALKINDCDSIHIGANPMARLDNPIVKSWLYGYNQLPRGRYRDALADSSKSTLLRTMQHAGRIYFYVLNDSPWTVSTEIEFAATSRSRFVSLNSEAVATWQRARLPVTAITPSTPAVPLVESATTQFATSAGERFVWQRQLQPFGLAVGMITDEASLPLRIETRLPENVVESLQNQYADIASRLTGLRQPQEYQSLANPDFESEDGPQIDGWEWGPQPQADVARDAAVFHQGAASMRITSAQSVAWARSEPLPVPRTGRLAVQAMLRFEPTRIAAPFRIALEGQYQGQPYYRYAQVIPPNASRSPGVAAAGNQPPTSAWTPFMLQVSNLPTEGLENLRVRFDLMGAGRVWVDDVQLFDLAFTPDEQTQLSRIVSLAEYQLREGRPASCVRTLDQFWPRYLTEFATVTHHQVATNTEVPEATTTKAPAEPITPRSQNPSFLGRVRELLPILR